MENLNKLLKMKKRLNRHADALGLSYRCDFNFLAVEGDFIHLNIESRNTFKYSFRLSDSRMVREGTLLSGVGLSIPQVYKRVLSDLRSHAKRIALLKEAKETNCVLFRDTLIVVENIDANEYMDCNSIFELIFDDGSTSRWYGFSAENAVQNSQGFTQGLPVMIRFVSDESNSMEQGA